VIAGAPPFTEHLCEACAQHFQQLRSYLEALAIPYTINPRLVRGLDYYTRTVFEFQPLEEGAQNTIGAGGRYDGLIEELGGKPTPAIGFATGVERIILNLKRVGFQPPPLPRPTVFVISQTGTERPAAVRLAGELRREGVATVLAAGHRSLKAQMRQADAIGAAYAAIIGREELASETVVLRRMADGQQERVALGQIAQVLAQRTASPL
jgi:histidyl-tRNA synthetase